MRKKSINLLFENIFWYLIYLLPLFSMLILLVKTGSASMSGAMNMIGFDILQTSDIYVALDSIFGASGVVPVFASSGALLFASYYVIAFLLHLAVDFLLFIPKIANKWLNKMYGGDE